MSGGDICVIHPDSNLVVERSSTVGISIGGRSLEISICLFSSCNVLKVWKNSSCVCSLPARNCISSTSNISTLRYLFLKFSDLFYIIVLLYSFVYFFVDIYITFLLVYFLYIYCLHNFLLYL